MEGKKTDCTIINLLHLAFLEVASVKATFLLFRYIICSRHLFDNSSLVGVVASTNVTSTRGVTGSEKLPMRALQSQVHPRHPT